MGRRDREQQGHRERGDQEAPERGHWVSERDRGIRVAQG
jgi:hypothetical protein